MSSTISNRSVLLVLSRLDPRNQSQMAGVLEIIQATSSADLGMADVRKLVQYSLGLVACVDGRVLGCLFYSGYPNGRRIEIVAVLPGWWRAGIGRALVNDLKQRLCVAAHVKEITALVPESLLPVQLFFRACRFRCVEILKHADAESQYLFVIQKQPARCGESLEAALELAR